MNAQLETNLSIGKINDKFYIFAVTQQLGGVFFSQASPAFHTSEDAHAFLVEKAKSQSTNNEKFICMEIERSFAFIVETVEETETENETVG